jgi:hypothetical protein
MAIVYPIFVARTVYYDHTGLRYEAEQANARLNFRQTHGLSLKVTGFVIAGENTFPIMQLVVSASNDGEPTTARDWELNISSAKLSAEGTYVVGRPRLNGSPELLGIDTQLQEPMNSPSQRSGLVSFVFSSTPRSALEALYLDPTATITVNAIDSNGKRVEGSLNVADTYNRHHQELPPNRTY